MYSRILLIAPLLAAGCAPAPAPVECTLEFSVQVTPDEQTIRVGESFVARAEAVTCGGRHRAPHAVGWRTMERQIVSIDQESGRITGLAPGIARVTAHEPTVSADWAYDTVRVTVRPR